MIVECVWPFSGSEEYTVVRGKVGNAKGTVSTSIFCKSYIYNPEYDLKSHPLISDMRQHIFFIFCKDLSLELLSPFCLNSFNDCSWSHDHHLLIPQNQKKSWQKDIMSRAYTAPLLHHTAGQEWTTGRMLLKLRIFFIFGW